jgi:hypothetical protein
VLISQERRARRSTSGTTCFVRSTSGTTFSAREIESESSSTYLEREVRGSARVRDTRIIHVHLRLPLESEGVAGREACRLGVGSDAVAESYVIGVEY